MGEVKLIDGSAGSGNRWRKHAPVMRLWRMKNSTSATSASRWPVARGRLLLNWGTWAYEGGGWGNLREQHRRQLERSEERHVDRESWSLVYCMREEGKALLALPSRWCKG
jgi:hypothetical protein